MANWVTHYFHIKSPSITAEELNRRFCSKDEDGELNLDFNKIVPCEDNDESQYKNWGFYRWYKDDNDQNGFGFEDGVFVIGVECNSTAQPIAKALSSITQQASFRRTRSSPGSAQTMIAITPQSKLKAINSLRQDLSSAAENRNTAQVSALITERNLSSFSSFQTRTQRRQKKSSRAS